MANNSVVLDHPQIGPIRGISPGGGVSQYLGIQYATLVNRFCRGQSLESYTTPVDATKLGPLPVANPKNCDIEHRLLQHDLPHPDYSFSDTECLRLHVTAPSRDEADQQGFKGRLPVLVFLHGGGFVTGSGSWPQWDLARLVGMSVKDGYPIVGVSINYRLGPFGFLTSATLREAGYLPNNGLHDQKLGLRWVKRYIEGFGGDPARITLLGCSIGGVSAFIHLQSQEPLFNQLIAMGGNALMPVLPPPVGEFAFAEIIKALALDSLSPAEQVQALLDMPAEELHTKVSDVHVPLNGVLDNDIIRSIPTFQSISETQSIEHVFPGIDWCKRIFMGDCQMDGMILVITALGSRKDNLSEALQHCTETVFGQAVPDLLFPYDGKPATASEGSQTHVPIPVVNFAGDICFSQGARACAQTWASASAANGTEAYLALFNAPNPWPGPWHGHATHVLDMAFALQNFNEFLPPGQRLCAERVGRDIIKFTSGESPFEPLHMHGRAMVYYAGVDGEENGSREAHIDDYEGTGRHPARDSETLDKMMSSLLLLLQAPS